MWSKRHICGGCGAIVSEWPYTRCVRCRKNDKKNLLCPKSFSSKIEYINEQKNRPCTDCHISYPYYVMDFDHLPQYEKLFSIGGSMSKGKSLYQIQKEIAKCEVVCANCHRIRTHNRSKDARILKEAELPTL